MNGPPPSSDGPDAVVIERLLAGETEKAEAFDALALELFPTQTIVAEQELARPWTRLWVARREGRPGLLGMLAGWHVADELHVLHVGVAPAARRLGVGLSLMEASIAYAAGQGVRVVLLEVRRSNHAAIALYRKLGMTTFGVRRGYYSDNGEDAVELLLALDPLTGERILTRDEVD